MDCTEKKKEFTSLLHRNTYDVILSDFKLPGFDAFGALQLSIEICPNVPFICISGSIGEETAIELIKRGAVDYVLKDRLVRLPSAIKRALDELKEKDARRRAEKALHESEEIFNRFMEHSPIYVFFKDENIRSLRLSKNYETMLGKPMSELLGKNMEDLFPSKLAKSMVADDMRILKEGKEIIVEEELNGRFYTTIKFPIHIEGKPRYLVGYTIDITERKRAEEALQESERKLRLVFENVFDGLCVFEETDDPSKRRLIDCNEHYAQMAGRSREELLKLGTTQDISKSLSEDNTYSIERGVVFTGLFSWNRPDGKDNIVEYTAVPLTLQGKRYTIGIDRDITERKRAEETLQKSEENFQSIMRSINDIVYKVDGKTQEFTYLSPAFERLLGYKMEDIRKMGGRRAFLSLVIHGGQFNEQDNTFKQLQKGKKEVPAWKAWWQCKDGRLVYLEDRSVPVYEGEQLVSTQGILSDITERKQAEEATRESRQMLRLVLDTIPVRVF
jgi:PAS domain S-box-containing protein